MSPRLSHGAEHGFARQVHAHGRPGDVLVLLSTSGRGPNVLAATGTAREGGVRTWAFTGPMPDPLGRLTGGSSGLGCPPAER